MKIKGYSQVYFLLFSTILLVLYISPFVGASIFTAGNPGEFGAPRSVSGELDGSKSLSGLKGECTTEEGNTCFQIEEEQKDLRDVEGKSGFKLMNLTPEEKRARVERAKAIREKRLADEEIYRETKAIEKDVHTKMEHDKIYQEARLQKEQEMLSKREERKREYQKLKEEKLAKMNPEERRYYEEQLALEEKRKQDDIARMEEEEELKRMKKTKVQEEINRKLDSLNMDKEDTYKLIDAFGLKKSENEDKNSILQHDLGGISKATKERIGEAMKVVN